MPKTSAVALATGSLLGGAVWAVRGRSSAVFGPSVWHGDPGRKAIALTFDDGPGPSTPRFLEILGEHRVPATFFQVGTNVLRHPEIARAVVAQGHEPGNHSHTHANFALKSPALIMDDFTRAQTAIGDVTGVRPVVMRPPYGLRWFGFRDMQKKLGLTGVMWTVIGRDWKYSTSEITHRILSRIRGGGIICLHDGRGTSENPDVTPAIEALRRIVPALIGAGYHFETVSELLCQTI
jgi:peptidoglycan/xylan/chitin deacetylase (PgdA/CDA1 family)